MHVFAFLLYILFQFRDLIALLNYTNYRTCRNLSFYLSSQNARFGGVRVGFIFHDNTPLNLDAVKLAHVNAAITIGENRVTQKFRLETLVMYKWEIIGTALVSLDLIEVVPVTVTVPDHGFRRVIGLHAVIADIIRIIIYNSTRPSLFE